jgi:hypothetical protein
MATLKNPSIYDDRSTIGSADELDEYGVWVKIEPEELSDADIETFPDFDIDFGPELPPEEEFSEGGGILEDFPSSGDGEEAAFDDLEALRQDIESFPPPQDDTADEPAAAEPAAPEGGAADLSTLLLMKIADELSAIKGELSTLKGELSAIRSKKPGSGGAEEGGFFDEEDDDKIALTGDELDNIIHTADFTEETGFDAGESPADDFAEPDLPADPSGEGGEIIYDGLGRPLRGSPPEDFGPAEPAAEALAAETASDEAGIIYDGLGRPLNRKIPEEDNDALSFDAPLDEEEPDDLQSLRENGVEPMTPAPEDTSYLEEDPLAEETLDLSDAVIDEPDLSEGLRDTPPEEPSLDQLPLIDLENIEENAPEEEADPPLFEDIAFEDMPEPDIGEMETLTNPASPEEAIDLSFFDDDFLMENTSGDTAEAGNAGDLSFEVLDEDAELPAQDYVQDNLITEDSFESIPLDDEGEIDEVAVDGDLEQSLPDGIKLEPDLSLPEIDELLEDTEAEEDINFDLPGSADTADAGDPASAPAEAPPPDRMGLREILVYMDKLLESLPEEKINEFAQSEHYATYKKLFEELGIQP